MSFQTLFDFEQALARYTGAPYAIVTDCCTHAIELCMRWDQVKHCEFTAYTYLSVPMIMHRLGIEYKLTDEHWAGEYQFHGTRIWDSARRLEPGMYREGQLQCLSFGRTKPLELGRMGAVLTDDVEIYDQLSHQRSDGRDLRTLPWSRQQKFRVGWHYCPTLEICQQGLAALVNHQPRCQIVEYPDCRKILIES